MKILLLLLVISSCSTPDKGKQTPSPLPSTSPVVVLPGNSYNTPNYWSNSTLGPTYQEALNLVKQYANTDEFAAFVVKKRVYFSHTPKKVQEAVDLFRSQLDKGGKIQISFYTPFTKGKAIGGWDGVRINQNSKFYLNAIDRARHILHETSHKYGWVHQGNSSVANDNPNSFPYAIGYDFGDFLELKLKTKIAAE